MDFSVKAPSVLCVAVNPEFHDALVCVALGLMCPLLPCLALTLIPVFGEIITDYCLKKISPVLMAKHSSGLVAPCLEAVNGSSWMALKQAARGKKPKRPRNKGQEGEGGGEGPNVFQFLTTCMVQATKTLAMATI